MSLLYFVNFTDWHLSCTLVNLSFLIICPVNIMFAALLVSFRFTKTSWELKCTESSHEHLWKPVLHTVMRNVTKKLFQINNLTQISKRTSLIFNTWHLFTLFKFFVHLIIHQHVLLLIACWNIFHFCIGLSILKLSKAVSYRLHVMLPLLIFPSRLEM